MAVWLIFLSLFLCLALKFLLDGRKKRLLPPGPPGLPIFGNLFSLGRSFADLEQVLKNLHAKYGPIITLYIGPRPAIFISDHAIAHQALIQNSAVFADRPPSHDASRIITSNQHNISSAAYGPLWRLLRRNLMSELLNPSGIKSFSQGREWVLNLLISRLRDQARGGSAVRVKESFQFAMFCLLLLMCFGEKLEEDAVREVETVQRDMLVNFARFATILSVFPSLGKIVFRKQLTGLLAVRRRQEKVLIPLIRKEEKQKEQLFSYVDTLLTLDLPEGRKLSDAELVSLCSEFLNAGTDTTATALQWIMANLIKHPQVQAKLKEEIDRVVGPEGGVKEEDLQKMPYLKAVIMEGLRRHPPGHLVLPHAVSEEITLEGYVIPKEANVNFMVGEMGIDPEVWEEPLEFKPERFLGGATQVDITGTREIKMMPFGAGRRICPGLGLAMLHLEYFVANLLREFEWKVKEGDAVDLSETLEFTVVMKNPLEAVLVPRIHCGK